MAVLASHFQGRALNSPNDIVVASTGDIFFTDPIYGRLAAPYGEERPEEMGFRGSIAWTAAQVS
jgi:gluconolactonase